MSLNSKLEIDNSCYDAIIKEKREKFTMTGRILLSFGCNDITLISNTFTAINKYFSDYNLIPALSGLLIQRENILLLFAESDNKTLNLTLEWIRSNILKNSKDLKSNILAFNEEYPERIFEYFSSDVLKFSGLIKLESEKPPEDYEKIIWEIYSKFLTAGNIIGERLRENSNFTSTLLKEALNYIQMSPDDLACVINNVYPSLLEYLEDLSNSKVLQLDSQECYPSEPYLSEYKDFEKEPYDKYNGLTLI